MHIIGLANGHRWLVSVLVGLIYVSACPDLVRGADSSGCAECPCDGGITYLKIRFDGADGTLVEAENDALFSTAH